MYYFNRPFPLEFDFKKNISLSLTVGLFVFLFLYIFQPPKVLFSIDTMSLVDAFIYGTISFGTMIFFYHFLLVMFPKVFNEDKWTVLKSIFHNLALLFFITFFNFIFSVFTIHELDLVNFFEIMAVTFLIGIFPVFGLVFYSQNKLLKQYLAETESINNSLSKKKDIKTINLVGKGKNEKFNFEISNLLFIKSIGNYCEIHLAKNKKPFPIRNSLIDIQNQIRASKIYKCHRSYLVNLQNVKKISGDAQGLKLHFKNVEISVPVSRNLTKEIKELLLNLNF